MIRFHNSEINLKSSVYNLAGENYFERLSAYNSMRSHIRRVLLAKSVVDARNNKYINEKKRQAKSQLCKRYSLDNLIDELAYDTKHHPLDLLRTNLDEFCSHHTGIENNQIYPSSAHNIDLSQLKMQSDDTDNIHTICRNYSIPKSKKKTRNKSAGRRHIKVCQKPLQRIIQRCDEKPIYVNCDDPIEPCTNRLHSNSGTSAGSMIQENHASSSIPCPLQNITHKCAEFEAKEDARYIEFAYDITREIIKHGLYTDKELNEIFKKHLKRHRNTLDLNKMLREIYRLKTFLNVSQESDDSDDDIEVCNNNQTWQLEVRPPTPPKVLDDNKVIGKLLSYQKLIENQCNKEPNSGKSVVLIDANPELLITERDVLTSLLEVGIDPKQAEHICKSLQHKSMEGVLENMAELAIGTPLSGRLEKVEEIQTENLVCTDKTCYDDAKTETENETLSEKENKSSITDDLTSKQDETIQTQSCPGTLFYDNYTEPMCTTFSQLQERLPLNVDEVIQTEEIQINVGSRIKLNKLGVQITEVFRAKEKFIHENVDATHIPQADILAWSRDKIAAMKANASNVPEKPVVNTEYEYRIPITKSTQKLLSSHKRKKSPKALSRGEQAKLEKQVKKVRRDRTPQRRDRTPRRRDRTPQRRDRTPQKRDRTPRRRDRTPQRRDRTPQRFGTSKAFQSKSKSGPIKPRKGILQKKSKKPNQPLLVSSKAKIASTSNIIEKSIKPAKSVSTCISKTYGICITKIDTQANDKDNRRCVTQVMDTQANKNNRKCVTQVNEESKEQPDIPKVTEPEVTETPKN